MRTFSILLTCLGLATFVVVGKAEPLNPKSDPNVALDKWAKQDDPQLTPKQRRFISNALSYAIEKGHIKPEEFANCYFQIKPIKSQSSPYRYFVYFGDTVNYKGTLQIWRGSAVYLDQNGDAVSRVIYD